MGLGFAVGVVGVLILNHAAYSTILYRGLLKITEESFSGPPFIVVAELLVGLVSCFWAALTVPGKFLSIHLISEENSITALPENLDFIIFNHRGRAFPSHLDLKLKNQRPQGQHTSILTLLSRVETFFVYRLTFELEMRFLCQFFFHFVPAGCFGGNVLCQ